MTLIRSGALVAGLASMLIATPWARADTTSGTDALREQWLSANRAAIGRIAARKKRAVAQRQFDATLANVTQPGVATPTDMRAAAAAELARAGRYQLADQMVQLREKTLWERFWSWLGDEWDRFAGAFFSRAHLGRAGSEVLGNVLIALVGTALLFTLFRLAVNLQIERDARRPASHENLDATRNAHALSLRASELAARGAFAQAVRALFAAAVIFLDLRGIIRNDASATVGEMRREIRSRGTDLASSFDRLAREFVTAAYAEQPMGADDWERARESYAQLTARPEST